METINNLQNSIDKAKEALADMESELEAIKSATYTRWKPQAGKWYWTPDGFGSADRYRWEDCTIDNNLYEIAEVFPTKEEAEAYTLRQKAIVRVTDAINKLNEGWKPNWDCKDGEIYCDITYSHTRKTVMQYKPKTFNVVTTVSSSVSCPLLPPIGHIGTARTIISDYEDDLKLIWGVE